MIKGWPNPYSLERTINHTGLLLITVKDYLYVKVLCVFISDNILGTGLLLYYYYYYNIMNMMLLTWSKTKSFYTS